MASNIWLLQIIEQDKRKQDKVLLVGERTLCWLQRYLIHVRPEILVTPDSKALFLAMDGVAGLIANGITQAVVPYLQAARIDKGSFHLFHHAMATQMRGPAVDTGDAGPPERGVYADIYTGKHPGASGGARVNASGGALGGKTKLTEKKITAIMTPQATPQKECGMSTIHFRIDEETKRLAMQAAERKKMSLTEIMRQRAEELAAEERQYQDGEHDAWLEQQIAAAFSRYDAGEGNFISDDEMNHHMDELKAQAARGSL